MTTIKLVIAYDGTDFHGFARQHGLRTVQGVIEMTLGRVLGSPVEVHGSGRTDAGVHARAQVVHFEQQVGPPAANYVRLLNRAFPKDIVAIAAEEVPSTFHARFSVDHKTYRYVLQLGDLEDVFTKRYSWHVPHRLDFHAMRDAAQYLVGEHDFTSFCAGSTATENKVRRILSLDVIEDHPYCRIFCTGTGFLQNMVRIIVGTLVDVGLGRFNADRIPHILCSRDRTQAGRTAPAHGLALWCVEYKDSLDQRTSV